MFEYKMTRSKGYCLPDTNLPKYKQPTLPTAENKQPKKTKMVLANNVHLRPNFSAG